MTWPEAFAEELFPHLCVTWTDQVDSTDTWIMWTLLHRTLERFGVECGKATGIWRVAHDVCVENGVTLDSWRPRIRMAFPNLCRAGRTWRNFKKGLPYYPRCWQPCGH